MSDASEIRVKRDLEQANIRAWDAKEEIAKLERVLECGHAQRWTAVGFGGAEHNKRYCVLCEIDDLRQRLAAAEARYDTLAKSMSCYRCADMRERLSAAEAAAAESRRIMNLAVGRTEETLARLLFAANTERVAAVEAARTLFDDLSQFTRVEWLLERWPWLADEAKEGRE